MSIVQLAENSLLMLPRYKVKRSWWWMWVSFCNKLPPELTKPGAKTGWTSCLVQLDPRKGICLTQLYPTQTWAVLAHRECKPWAVRQTELFLMWSKWLQVYWCRVEFGATSVEAPPFQWKVQCWESAGNAWSQQQASAHAAGEAGCCTSWLRSVGFSNRANHSAIPAVAFLSPGAAVLHCDGLKLWAMGWAFVFPLLTFPSSIILPVS